MGISAMAKSGHVYVMATSASFAAIVVTQIGNGFNCRSNTESVFKIGLFSNRFYLWGIVCELGVVLALFYIPPLQKIFGTKPISGLTWLFLFIWPVVILFAEEARKAIARGINSRKKHRSEPAEQAGVKMAA